MLHKYERRYPWTLPHDSPEKNKTRETQIHPLREPEGRINNKLRGCDLTLAGPDVARMEYYERTFPRPWLICSFHLSVVVSKNTLTSLMHEIEPAIQKIASEIANIKLLGDVIPS